MSEHPFNDLQHASIMLATHNTRYDFNQEMHANSAFSLANVVRILKSRSPSHWPTAKISGACVYLSSGVEGRVGVRTILGREGMPAKQM